MTTELGFREPTVRALVIENGAIMALEVCWPAPELLLPTSKEAVLVPEHQDHLEAKDRPLHR